MYMYYVSQHLHADDSQMYISLLSPIDHPSPEKTVFTKYIPVDGEVLTDYVGELRWPTGATNINASSKTLMHL